MSLNIEIRRYRIRGACCDGHLYIKGKRVCDCAENAYHRLPAGRYKVVIGRVEKERRRMPVLVPTDNDYRVTRGAFPYLKVGNGIYTLRQGQIIVGQRYLPGVLLHSYDAFLPLYNRIYQFALRKKEVFLTIDK